VLSFYLGSRGKPWLSGITFGLAFFDPRFALISIPLFLVYNRASLAGSSIAATAAAVLSNFAILFLFPGVLPGFLSMLFTYGLSTPIYIYSLIPILTVAVLTIVNWRGIVDLGRDLFFRTSLSGVNLESDVART
jgi:hypothetical protein